MIELAGREAEDRLTETFAALANSTRRAILARLAEGEATVTELAQPFDLSLPAISKHIKVLEEAGLIRQGRKAQFRPCTIAVEPLRAVLDWTTQYRHIWEASFDRMESYLHELDQGQPNEQPSPQEPGQTRKKTANDR